MTTHTSTYTSAKSIVVTGFMGTGKTTVGQLLAQRLGRSFVDMDSKIVEHFGKPISAVFADQGEAAFRAVESQLCRELAAQENLVIATGGGALVDAGNRYAFTNRSDVICLTATASDVIARLEKFRDRPLLAGSAAERQEKVQTLLNERQSAYAEIPHQVSTTDRSPDEIADAILALLGHSSTHVAALRIDVSNPLGSYPIHIGDGILQQSGHYLREQQLRVGSVAIVTNAMVGERHADALAASLREAGFEPTLCILPEGEEHKTLASIASLYDQFLAAKLDRQSAVIALGGGVIGDMTGFAAASYLRGVPFVQIPTSLLSMVDASVGGKTGVDLPQGKNLVGAFKQPELVIIDTSTLKTLSKAEFQSGMAEVIKHGIIDAPKLFQQLETSDPTDMVQLVADAVQVKVDVVQEDPYEQGRRAVLNLGHTFGHAIELISHFKVRHGEGVALGVIAATHLAVSLGRCSGDLVERVYNVMARVGLPTQLSGYGAAEIHAAMGHDKKRTSKSLRFIIPQDIGDVVMIDDPGESFVLDALKKILV